MKDKSPIKLSQLRVLIAVAEQRSFSAAALRLEMSQSAVSHAIATLENSLGVILTSRNRQGAYLTPVGERITDHAQAILRHSGEIIKEAALARGLDGGQIRIASFRSVATHLLPSLIATFHQRFPAITLSLTEHDDYLLVEQALREGRSDIGFTFLPTGQEFKAWEVLKDEYLALFPSTFQLSSDTLTWHDLTKQSLILPPVHDVMMQRVFEHVQQAGYSLQATYEVETDAAIVNLVSQGIGATILPRLAAEPIPTNIQVYSLPKPLMRSIGAAVFANGLYTPAVYAFLEVINH